MDWLKDFALAVYNGTLELLKLGLRCCLSIVGGLLVGVVLGLMYSLIGYASPMGGFVVGLVGAFTATTVATKGLSVLAFRDAYGEDLGTYSGHVGPHGGYVSSDYRGKSLDALLFLAINLSAAMVFFSIHGKAFETAGK